jgi:hypothetical protein
LQLTDRVQKLRKALRVGKSALHNALTIEFSELWDDLLELVQKFCPALFPAAGPEEVVETEAESSRMTRSSNRNQQVFLALQPWSFIVTALVA